MRILVLEDERQLARHITRALVRNGHSATAHMMGWRGLRAALDLAPDLVVLDLGLPGRRGMEVLAGDAGQAKRGPRPHPNGPGRGRTAGQGALRPGQTITWQNPSRWTSLSRGSRPWAGGGRPPRRRTSSPWETSTWMSTTGEVSRAGRAVALSPREFDVLQLAHAGPGRVFSRTELCERVWQRDHEYDTRTVEIFITRLRKKVDSGFANP